MDRWSKKLGAVLRAHGFVEKDHGHWDAGPNAAHDMGGSVFIVLGES